MVAKNRAKSRRTALAAMMVLIATPTVPGMARTIGEMTPAEPLTAARIAALPEAERAAWTSYLDRSSRLMAADKAALAAERGDLAAIPTPPADGPSGGGMDLDGSDDWYASPAAIAIADNIVSFQTPAGGWGKNQDRRGPSRVKGQGWVTADLRAPRDTVTASPGGAWHYVGTFDNGATISEIRFLAKVQAQRSGRDGDSYRNSVRRGIAYMLAAQFPNGGFPQVYPLEGGYHDAITFNDDALTDIARVLRDAAAGASGFEFLDAETRVRAARAHAGVLALILRCQVRIDGVPTIWGQQYDSITQIPVGARNFEPASLSTGESAGVLMFLMEEAQPTPQIVTAIDHGIAWLRSNAIADVEWTKPVDETAKRLLPREGAGPVWPRFVDLTGRQALFGDRDRTIHDDVADLIPERRNGYSWYVTAPAKALKTYDRWKSVRRPDDR